LGPAAGFFTISLGDFFFFLIFKMGYVVGGMGGAEAVELLEKVCLVLRTE
jgi:hypothetical protein